MLYRTITTSHTQFTNFFLDQLSYLVYPDVTVSANASWLILANSALASM